MFWRAPRAARYVATAILLTLCSGLLVAPVSAYTPYDSPQPRTGAEPEVTVEMTHSKVEDRDPVQGEVFTYTATFGFAKMSENGVKRHVVLTVTADPNAPFASPVTAGDFHNETGSATASSVECSGYSCTATYSDMSDGRVVFSKEGKVSAGLGPGEMVAGAASAHITSTGSVALKHGAQRYTPDSGPAPCSGTAEWEILVPQAGGWIADLKFADVYASGKVTFDDAPLVDGLAHPESKNAIIVRGPDGADLTAGVLKEATFNSADPSQPFLGLDEVSLAHPHAIWLQSVNWPFDISNYTGKTWIPSGTTITIKKHLTFYDCSIAGFPSPADYFNSRWKAGIALQIARPNTSISAAAQTYFVTPGKAAPASCVNKLYVVQESNSRATSKAFYEYDPAQSRSRAISAPNQARTQAIAATNRFPELLFSTSPPDPGSNPHTYILDTSQGVASDRQPHAVEAADTPATMAMAFDSHGYLWAIDDDGYLFYLTDKEIAALVSGGTATWHRTGQLEATGRPSMRSAFDLAFDANDRMYIARPSHMYRISRDVMMSTGHISVGSSIGSLPTWPNGMAFLGDKLYVAEGWRDRSNGTPSSGQTQTVYEFDIAAGRYRKANLPGYTVLHSADLASCSFPGESSDTGFKVKKSVIDPVTGAVSPAGTTSPHPVHVHDDGTVVVDYLVTVSLVGSTAERHPDISDQVSLPEGFQLTDVLLDGTSQGKSGTFTIPGANLDPAHAATTAKVYRVQIHATAPDMNRVSWSSAATCQTEEAGDGSAGGFFNAVTMEQDSDGPNNNDACVPTKPNGKAHLRLIKRIVDRNGHELTELVDQAQYFTLVAGGPTRLHGVSAASGHVAADADVLPGTYRLDEQPNDSGAHTSTYAFGTWSCDSGKVPDKDRQISIADGDDVTCTVTNTPRPQVHITKTATEPAPAEQNDPAGVNPHIGTLVVPGPDGSVLLRYTMTLTSTSSYPGDTGAVSDTFQVPAGMVWDGDKSATVAFDPGSTGASVTDLATSVTKEQLHEMAMLTSSVRNLPSHGSVMFTITIPLRTDNTVREGESTTVFAENAEKLGTCANLTSAAGNPYSDASKGIPNVVTLLAEDLAYNDIPRQDNLACIPVSVGGALKVSKWANAETSSHVGANPVSFDANGQATVSYWVKLSNSGPAPMQTGKVTDIPRVPTGTRIVGPSFELNYTLNGNTGSVNGAALTEGHTRTVTEWDGGAFVLGDRFDLTPAKAGSDSAPPVIITVTYRIELAGAHAAENQHTELAIGTCTTVADGTVPDTSGGVVNKVAVSTDNDGDGQENNQACHPVQPRIQVVKLGAHCDVGADTCHLPGANFALYPDDGSGSRPADHPIDSGIGPSAADGAVFTSLGLQIGAKYWLVETTAPAGHELLARPVGFTIGADGLEIFAGGGVFVAKANGLALTINITDTTAADLPMTGGSGRFPTVLLALLLMVVGAGALLRSQLRPTTTRAA